MKRRWKVGMALAVVGLAGFLVWAFRYEPKPGVSIRFLGYETSAPPLKVADISARFCLTNGSTRAIVYNAMGSTPLLLSGTKTKGGGTNLFRNYWGGETNLENMVLQPDQSVCFTLRIYQFDQPFCVTIPYGTNLPPPGYRAVVGQLPGAMIMPRKPAAKFSSAWLKDRFARLSPWSRDETSVSITIQDR